MRPHTQHPAWLRAEAGRGGLALHERHSCTHRGSAVSSEWPQRAPANARWNWVMEGKTSPQDSSFLPPALQGRRSPSCNYQSISQNPEAGFGFGGGAGPEPLHRWVLCTWSRAQRGVCPTGAGVDAEGSRPALLLARSDNKEHGHSGHLLPQSSGPWSCPSPSVGAADLSPGGRALHSHRGSEAGVRRAAGGHSDPASSETDLSSSCETLAHGSGLEKAGRTSSRVVPPWK